MLQKLVVLRKTKDKKIKFFKHKRMETHKHEVGKKNLGTVNFLVIMGTSTYNVLNSLMFFK